jgi:membrane fusion protein (multidrug efflux system)
MMITRSYFIFVLSLFLLAACSGNDSRTANSDAGGPRLANIFAEPLQEREFASKIEALGTLMPNEQVDLTLNAADRVQSIYFDDGERVHKGQTLLSLAQREQRALVEAEEARVAEARQQLDRMMRLIESRAVSQAEVDEAKRDLNSARAQLRAVQSRQKDRILIAPFDGILGFRQVSVGSYVQPGSVVARLVDDKEMNLEFDIPSTFIRVLSEKSEVIAKTDDLPSDIFYGTVTSVDNAIDPVTRSVTVRATLPNPDRVLVSGMFMDVTINADPRTVPAVPEEAVQSVGPRNFIFTIQEKDGQQIAERTEIQLGLYQDGYVEVKSGVQTGTLIVTEGLLQVREGAPVKIQSPDILNSTTRSSGGTTSDAFTRN